MDVREPGHASPRMHGFTVVELLATVTVVIVLATIAGPALQGTLARVRVANACHHLTASLALARSTAIRRGRSIGLCPSHDGRSCSGGTSWHAGWIVFSEAPRTAHGPPPPGTPAFDVIHHQQGLGPGLRLDSSAGRQRVRFTPDGFAFGQNVTFNLCDARAERLHARIVLNNGGRTRSERHPESAACPGGSAPN